MLDVSEKCLENKLQYQVDEWIDCMVIKITSFLLDLGEGLRGEGIW